MSAYDLRPPMSHARRTRLFLFLATGHLALRPLRPRRPGDRVQVHLFDTRSTGVRFDTPASAPTRRVFACLCRQRSPICCPYHATPIQLCGGYVDHRFMKAPVRQVQAAWRSGSSRGAPSRRTRGQVPAMRPQSRPNSCRLWFSLQRSLSTRVLVLAPDCCAIPCPPPLTRR